MRCGGFGVRGGVLCNNRRCLLRAAQVCMLAYMHHPKVCMLAYMHRPKVCVFQGRHALHRVSRMTTAPLSYPDEVAFFVGGTDSKAINLRLDDPG